MRTSQGKVILVTGASSGIGLACSVHLSQRGHRVYGTSRNPNAGSPLQEGPFFLEMLRMDVTSDESVQRGIEQIISAENRLDVVINNAGFGYGGSIEDTSIEEAKHLFETNVWGVLRVCRAVLSAMRAQGSGLILNVSSLGGLMALPFQGVYSASKFAVEGLTEALRMEVKPFGINVVLVEPGDVATEFTANRVQTEASQTDLAYREQFQKTLGIVAHDEVTGMASEQVARLVARILDSSHPRLRYQSARPIQRVAAGLHRLLPGSLVELLLRRHYGLEG